MVVRGVAVSHLDINEDDVSPLTFEMEGDCDLFDETDKSICTSV